jgi:hypothetical protein
MSHNHGMTSFLDDKAGREWKSYPQNAVRVNNFSARICPLS